MVILPVLFEIRFRPGEYQVVTIELCVCGKQRNQVLVDTVAEFSQHFGLVLEVFLVLGKKTLDGKVFV